MKSLEKERNLQPDIYELNKLLNYIQGVREKMPLVKKPLQALNGYS